MNKKINDKINEIKTYLKEFDTILPATFEEYSSNLEKKAACERYVEKIMEAVTDIAFLIIKYRKYEIPEDDKNAFDILLKHKIITEKTCTKMKEAKGMRNLIVHEYGNVDDEIVFDSITKELIKDVKKFLDELPK